jgi:hypothetical protein
MILLLVYRNFSKKIWQEIIELLLSKMVEIDFQTLKNYKERLKSND